MMPIDNVEAGLAGGAGALMRFLNGTKPSNTELAFALLGGAISAIYLTDPIIQAGKLLSVPQAFLSEKTGAFFVGLMGKELVRLLVEKATKQFKSEADKK